jgi:Ca2+-binding RTX toxin-like protein
VRRAALIGVGLALVAPVDAFGATVSRVLEDGLGSLEYYAEAGEANDLMITNAARTMTITDAGAVIVPGLGCTAVSDHKVSCSPVDRAAFFLADLDDKAAVSGGTLAVDILGGGDADSLRLCANCGGRLAGGPGDDTLLAGGLGSLLVGESGNDILDGGAGIDEISGGAGADTISGRRGADRISPGSGADSIDGGRARDLLSFDSAPGPMLVDLRAGTATGWGTKSLARIENVVGTAHSDELRGSRASNVLSGLGRNNVIIGRGGDDVLVGAGDSDTLAGSAGSDVLRGGGGRDRMFGGRGPDTLRTRDGRRDLVAGGSGRDRARVDSLDVLRSIEGIL